MELFFLSGIYRLATGVVYNYTIWYDRSITPHQIVDDSFFQGFAIGIFLQAEIITRARTDPYHRSNNSGVVPSRHFRQIREIYRTSRLFIRDTFPMFIHVQWLICVTLGSNMVADVTITMSLCWFLRRSKTGFEKTDSILDKLFSYVINTGLLTM